MQSMPPIPGEKDTGDAPRQDDSIIPSDGSNVVNIIGGAGGTSGSESDGELPDTHHYELLSQDPSAVVVSEGSSDESEESGGLPEQSSTPHVADGESSHLAASVPSSSPYLNYLPSKPPSEPTWGPRQPAATTDTLRMDDERVACIKAAMSTFTLPQSATPPWASLVSESQWQAALRTRIATHTAPISTDATVTDATAPSTGTTATSTHITAVSTDTTTRSTDTTAVSPDTAAISTDTTAVSTHTTAVSTEATAVSTDTTATDSHQQQQPPSIAPPAAN